ncbi:hypothetical protein SKAU_G00375330 [Synaphobranchus kaupii]|uniref:Uncharacterized protein n=1 Tax=Synaphobranchus kaupii TaxID=118154 RepID=A0A9Q1IG71_SYNKA|nr:hypothetical protein SKAU_G00375330 [Synaphobranchus kaupii]
MAVPMTCFHVPQYNPQPNILSFSAKYLLSQKAGIHTAQEEPPTDSCESDIQLSDRSGLRASCTLTGRRTKRARTSAGERRNWGAARGPSKRWWVEGGESVEVDGIALPGPDEPEVLAAKPVAIG